MEKIYKKYPWFKGAEGLEDEIKHMKINDVIDFLNDCYKEIMNSETQEENYELMVILKGIESKISDFDRELMLKETVESAKENLFSIVRREKFYTIFPEYKEIKRLTDKEYNDLIHKMPNEESRKKLENLLVKRILEKSDFEDFLMEDVENKLDKLLYKQIDTYKEMKPVGVFNSIYGYNLGS
tara:strand:+ start:2702 stop:3250 length:549 start_codon:yes stop_codon:yes gene_type:complete